MDDTLTSLSSSCLYSPPEFVSKLNETVEIVENSRALLKVVVKGVPLPQVVWHHNGNVLSPVKNIVNIIYEDGVSFLEIYNCTRRWIGEITCEATNSAGVCRTQSNIRKAAEVRRSRSPSPVDASTSDTSMSSAAGQAPAFSMTMPSQIYTKVNENIQLKCSFIGQPLPAVTWEKDGNLVDMNKNYSIITEDGITMLRVECTTLADNAIFSCTLANNFGMEMVYAVTLPSSHKESDGRERRKTSGNEEEPCFVQHLENRTFTGEDCHTQCIIMGNPIPQVEWTINNELVTKNE
ncbi:hypothetical protein KIN20_002995 [Parelaphostrongylus tenuis]|uniref:Ig-like domain-containing protein n=1 Tax=Parelaphostrongylus tenuis TaxID=148309 RepID=A0AAD5MF05_PARTN|nr:hypothetical protein KIN20_002995 [Parelaphostrongylus tenuis]